MTDRKLYPAVKKVSLAGLNEAWGADCYAYITPSTYADQKDVLAIKADEEVDIVAYQLEFVKSHFVSGKINAFNGEGFELIDMQPDHTAISVDVTDALYSAIMGFDLDPKEIRKAAQQNALQTKDSTAIETQ